MGRQVMCRLMSVFSHKIFMLGSGLSHSPVTICKWPKKDVGVYSIVFPLSTSGFVDDPSSTSPCMCSKLQIFFPSEALRATKCLLRQATTHFSLLIVAEVTLAVWL